MDLQQQLQTLGCEVSTDEHDLQEHSKDASLFSVKPSIVVFPRNAQDLKTLVHFVNNNKAQYNNLSITARSAGTDMSGGPLNESIIVSFTKYMHSFDIGDNNAVQVQPGVYFRDFEDKAEQQGLMFPSYPASKELCAWGGIINNNSGGELSLRYGKTNKFVEKMRVILSDGGEYDLKKLSISELEQKKQQQNFEGEVYTKLHALFEEHYEDIQQSRPIVSKNSAGYNIWDTYERDNFFDLTQLFVGAQGTLGLMVDAQVRLVSIPKHRRLAVLFLKHWDQVPDIVNELQPLDPESMEVFDDETLKLAIRFFPDIARRAEGQTMLKLAKEFLPDFWIGVKMLGLPKLVILVEIVEHSEQQADEKLQAVAEKTEHFKIKQHLIQHEQDAEKYWIVRRESFQLLRTHIKEKRTAPFIDDIIVIPEYLPEVLPKVLEILKQHNIKATLAGHAGDGNFHIIPLMDLSKKSEVEKIPIVSDKVYDLIIQYKGSITAEHNDGLIRSPYLQKMYGEQVFDIFTHIKNIFDPQNIFNPRKKIGSSMEYALEHIDHT